jgi:ribonuclease PH
MRTDGRLNNQIREIKIIPEIVRYAEGSVRIEMGHTHVICTASIEETLPKWLMGSGSGWITAEYGMLPRSTHTRIQREKANSSGRSLEISRLIGRSLRAAIDLKKLGERQIYIDCDVIQADGGTRTAAITGGFVAMALATKFLLEQGKIKSLPINGYLSAISVGIKGDEPILDLNYDEDSTIQTDMNFVMNQSGALIEIQGTAETKPFSQNQLLQMVELAEAGCKTLFRKQAEILGSFLPL